MLGNWRGGKSIKNGYILIYKPEHPFCDKHRYVPEHRLVWENYNNAILLPWIDVHHINGIKTDNVIENLQAITHVEHSRVTNKKDFSNRFCFLCKSKTTYVNKKTGYPSWIKHIGNYWICYKCYNKIRYIKRKTSNV